MNEARDTHRYLKRLEEAWEPLYQDISIEQMQVQLPGLLGSIRTMQTACRCCLSLYNVPLPSWLLCSATDPCLCNLKL